MADLYSQLNVPRGASEAEIKKAYRKLAKELHPDKNKDNPKATERFSKVTQAYDLLTDKDKRARFDRGEIDGDGNPTAPFGFGGGGPRPPNNPSNKSLKSPACSPPKSGRNPPCGPPPPPNPNGAAGLPSPSISPRSNRARLSLSLSRS